MSAPELRRSFREPLSQTLRRNLTIALVVGGAIALASRNIRLWPLSTLLALWPSLGGHFIEVCYLNLLRPRIAPVASLRAATRILFWFAGGAILAGCMRLTAYAFTRRPAASWLHWYTAGPAFVAIELLVHLFLRFRGQPNFYDGSG